MEQAIVFGISIAILISCFFIFRGERKKYFDKTMKILAIVYLVWVFFRYMLADSFIWVINKGIYDGVYYEKTDILQSILRWGHHTSYVVLTMACFFKSRLFKNVALLFCLPFAILTTCYFGNFMDYFMAVGMKVGRGLFAPEWFRSIYFMVELILAIVIPLLFVVVERHYPKFNDKTELKNFLISLPFMVIILVPVYLPQSLIGYTQYTTTALTIGNLIWLGITAIEIIVLYFIFRFKDYRSRYMLCMFLALGLFMHYNSLYLMGFTISRLPIQLCNLGAYFFVVALLIKNQKFFNFTFIANVVGTLIAMIAPDTEGGFAGFWNIHFLLEHMQVLVIPMLCMLLRIFKRIDKKAIKHLIIGFSIYFAFCFVSGTLLNGFAEDGGYGRVNFFYIFDLEKAFGYFPFISFTEKIHFRLFNRFDFWPVFQMFIYFGFLALCMLFYFVMIKFYDLLDDHFELRKARIDMFEKITGKKSKAKREYDEE